MKRFGGLAAVFCLLAAILTGCGAPKLPDVIVEPTIAVNGDGVITMWLVGEFDQDYYNLSEITAMAVEEAALFNASRESEDTPVMVQRVESLEDNNKKIVLSYRFSNWQNYTEFETEFGENQMLFYGTVGEAIQKGYDTKVILRSVKDNTLFTEEQLKYNTDKYLIITDAKANVYGPARVAYISDGAVMNEDGSVDTTSVQGTVYILLK